VNGSSERLPTLAIVQLTSANLAQENFVKQAVCLLVVGAAVLAALPAVAQGYPHKSRPAAREVETTGSVGRAPWQQPWEYDTGSDNDRRPELPYYQQGRGQQTGGPDRNLLPDDGLHIVPR
jgi:hypothetical protein